MRVWLAAFALVLGVAVPVVAIQPGDRIPPFTLEDQHGKAGQVDDRVRILLLTRDMDGGKVVREALADTDQSFFADRRAVYVADVSGMPALITRLFAVPGMRKRPYRILLDRDGAATRGLPHASGTVTVLRLDALRVTEVTQATTAVGLRQALDARASPPPR